MIGWFLQLPRSSSLSGCTASVFDVPCYIVREDYLSRSSSAVFPCPSDRLLLIVCSGSCSSCSLRSTQCIPTGNSLLPSYADAIVGHPIRIPSNSPLVIYSVRFEAGEEVIDYTSLELCKQLEPQQLGICFTNPNPAGFPRVLQYSTIVIPRPYQLWRD